MPNLRDLASDARKASQSLVATHNAVALKVAQEVEAKAVLQSSGARTAADRREADYPFATRHGRALWDRSTINVGRGVFRRSWLIEANPQAGGLIVYVVRNDADVAEWLEHGTPKMFSRPLREILVRQAQASWNRLAPPAFAAALSTAFR